MVNKNTIPKLIKDGVEPALVTKNDAVTYLGSVKLVARLIFAARHYPDLRWVDLVAHGDWAKNSKVLISLPSLYRAVERMIDGEEPPQITDVKNVARGGLMALALDLDLAMRSLTEGQPTEFGIQRGRAGTTKEGLSDDEWKLASERVEILSEQIAELSEFLGDVLGDGPDGLPEDFLQDAPEPSKG